MTAPSLTRRRVTLRERDAEVHALAAAVDRAADGRGGLVVVEAGAGLGKSHLLRVAAVAAAQAGLRVVRAGGEPLSAAAPFAVAVDLLGPLVHGAEPAVQAAMLRGSARVAGPMLRGEQQAHAADGPTQMALVHALHWVVLNLAEGRPLALVVDDLHWTDAQTLRLLGYLARRIADEPVLIVAARRPDEPAPDPDAVAELVAAATVLRPAALSPAATADMLGELLDAAPPRAFVDACAEATGGNPLAIRATVLALAGAPEPPWHDGAGAAPPAELARLRAIGTDALERSVAVALGRLSPHAADLATALAVLGPAAAALAPELAAVEDAAAAGDELREAGLAAPEGELTLVHPLVAAAVADAAPAAWRSDLHARAARLHAARGEIGAAAAQLVRSGHRSDPWAADVFVAAAEDAWARGGPGQAADLLEHALAAGVDPAREAAVLAELARTRAAAGDPRAEESFERAIAAQPDTERQAELLLALAWQHQAVGRFDAAVRASARGLSLGAGSAETLVELTAMHDAAVAWSGSDTPADAVGMPAQAAALVRRAGGRAHRVMLAGRARDETFAGTSGHASVAALALAAWDDGALLAGTTADDPALVRVLTSLHNADRLTEALAVAEACLQDAQHRASPMAHATWIHLRGHVLAYLGRLPEAEADLREAFAARADGWGAFLPVTVGALARVLLERGDVAGAGAVLEDGFASTTHPAASPMWTNATCARGRYRLAAGHAPDDAAAESLAAGERAVADIGAVNPALDPWRADAAEALQAAGRNDAALALADENLALARAWGAPRALARALRTRALVGPEDERGPLLQEAVAVVEGSEARLEHAHALAALGAWSAATGDPAARGRLRVALDVADRCGAEALTTRTHQLLVAAGGRPRRRRLSGPDSLTVSERRIAELAAEGLTTREIAEQLFVTPKAVSFHLGHVYRKLSISGRAALRDALG